MVTAKGFCNNARMTDSTEIEYTLPEEPRGEHLEDTVRRFERTVGPVLGGVVIDSIDLFTFGPLGVLGGSLVGGSVAYYIASVEELPVWQRTLLGIAAALYCAYPSANFIPAATLVGAVLKFVQEGRKRRRGA